MDIYHDFLSPEEIELLTARKQHKRQIEQLNQQGIPFVLTSNNRPIVRRDYATLKTPKSGKYAPSRPATPKVEWRSNAPKLEKKHYAKTSQT